MLIDSLVTAAIDDVTFRVIDLVVNRVHVVDASHVSQCTFRIHHPLKLDRFDNRIRVLPSEVAVPYRDACVSAYLHRLPGIYLSIDDLPAHEFGDVGHAGHNLLERCSAQPYYGHGLSDKPCCIDAVPEIQ